MRRLADPVGARERIRASVLALVIITILGTLGYAVIEGMGTLDSLYMTVITLSTVGYGEVKPLSPTGRAFSVVLIMSGLGVALYTVGALAQFFIEGGLLGIWSDRRMKNRIDSLDRHVILVGFGRFGRVVCRELMRNDEAPVVIELDASTEDELSELGIPYIIGSGLQDSILEAAGIQRARAIAVATPRDADSVYITLAARELNPSIHVHVRAETETGERRVWNAGATQVVSPHELGGNRMAQALHRPAVVDFIELAAPGSGVEIDLEEVLLADGCHLDGKRIGDLDVGSQLVVVGVLRPDADMELNPEKEMTLSVGERLVVVGHRRQLAELSQQAGGPNL